MPSRVAIMVHATAGFVSVQFVSDLSCQRVGGDDDELAKTDVLQVNQEHKYNIKWCRT